MSRLTIYEYDHERRMYLAATEDGREYLIDSDAVDENRQHAEKTGEYASPEDAWRDADRQWTTDAEGVTKAE